VNHSYRKLAYNQRERDHIAGQLASYREDKIKRQIDELEQEKLRLESEK
jgi:hypothetical protein